VNKANLEAHIKEHAEVARVYRNAMNFFLFYGVISAVGTAVSYYLGVDWLGLVWSGVTGWLLGNGVYKFRKYRAAAKKRDSLVAELDRLLTRSGTFLIEALEKIDHSKGSLNK